MASFTDNFNLKKPSPADWYDVADSNGNMDIIDNALKEIKETSDEAVSFTAQSLTKPQQAQARANIGAAEVIVATDIIVLATDFVSDTTYDDYPLKAEVSVAGVTADYIPNVTFGLEDATSANFAPVALSGAGIVTIYAKSALVDDITIPSIVCVKGGV